MALSAGLAAGLLAGCAKLLPVLIDGVMSPERPPQSKVRADLRAENQRLNQELAASRAREATLREHLSRPREARRQLPAEQAGGWEEARAILPASGTGGVDWMKALADGTVAPRPGLAADAAEQAVLDLAVELGRTPSRPFTVTYAHAPHTRWLACGNCHPAIFPLERKAPRPVITMAGIRAGEHCGRCHGPVAFGVEGNCVRCHTQVPMRAPWTPAPPRVPIEAIRGWEEVRKALPPTPTGPDWSKALAEGVIAPRGGIGPEAQEADVLDLDIERIPKEAGEAMKAVFPHASHTAWLACESCHTGLFEMQGGATPISMAAIGEGKACGACHGTVAFGIEACGRCHPALGGS